MKFINDNIPVYSHGTGKISNRLNRLLHEVLGCASAIILTIFFCKVKRKLSELWLVHNPELHVAVYLNDYRFYLFQNPVSVLNFGDNEKSPCECL
jgi:hypothetical protein